MKYAYMVTRRVTPEQPYCYDVPNLGLHSSMKSAVRHFKSVIKDREKCGATVCWASSLDVRPVGRKQETHEARIELKNGQTETLLIEKWSF